MNAAERGLREGRAVGTEGAASERSDDSGEAREPESLTSVAESPAGDPEELLEVAIELAREAGGLLLERFRSQGGGVVSTKSSPTDLVSEADLSSERVILRRLAALRPGDSVLAEESGGTAGEMSRSSGQRRSLGEAGSGAAARLRWIVDPLDGTINFLFGIPQWCVSIAVDDGRGGTLAGVIYDPCREELWSAVKEGPALLNGVAIRGSGRRELSTALVATGFAYDAEVRAAQAAVVARLLPRVRDVRRFGSAALDLAWTACGRCDAYFERSVKLWDIAAGALICRRAGLTVCELRSERGLPWGVLASAPPISEALRLLVGGQQSSSAAS